MLPWHGTKVHRAHALGRQQAHVQTAAVVPSLWDTAGQRHVLLERSNNAPLQTSGFTVAQADGKRASSRCAWRA